MSYTHVREHKICGICEANTKWIKLQYVDQWNDEVSFWLPVEDWKRMGKPFIGDKIHIEVTCHLS